MILTFLFQKNDFYNILKCLKLHFIDYIFLGFEEIFFFY